MAGRSLPICVAGVASGSQSELYAQKMVEVAANHHAEYDAAKLQMANATAEMIVGDLGGDARDLGQFTLAMHGFQVRRIFGDVGAKPDDAKDIQLYDDYVGLEEKFRRGRAIARVVSQKVAPWEDRAVPQIQMIALAEGHLQYRIRRIFGELDHVTGPRQHGYEGTVVLPVESLTDFEDDFSVAEEDILLARFRRSKSRLEGENSFRFDDRPTGSPRLFDDHLIVGIEKISQSRPLGKESGFELYGDAIFVDRLRQLIGLLDPEAYNPGLAGGGD